MPHSVDFGRYIERLGFRRPDEPEFSHAVQPVSIVHDASALVPPELGDIYLFGGRRGAVAAVFSVFQLSTTSRGALVEFWLNLGTTGAIYRYTVVSGAAAAVANSQAVTPVRLNENGRTTTTVSTGLGTFAAGTLDNSVPTLTAISNDEIGPLSLYIQPSSTLLVELATANTTIGVRGIYQEVERHRAQ